MNTHQQKPLRVLQVLPALEEGGVERGAVDLAKALCEQGHASFIASSGGHLLSQLNHTKTRHFTLPVHSKLPWMLILNAFRLKRLIKTYRIDLMHVRSRAPAWSCLLASKLSGIPYIATFHGQYGHRSRLKRFYNSAMLRGAACIAVSKFISQHISLTYPAIKTPICTIYRGIDTHAFNTRDCSPKTLIKMRSDWRIDPSRPVILLAARLTRIKGHALLLQAIHLLNRSDLQIIFLGSISTHSDLYRELENLIESLDLHKQVRFVGSCHNMAEAYTLADIVVNASNKPESFGRTIAEAQYMRCIPVAGDHGAARELICSDHPYLLYSPNNAQALAKSLAKVLSFSTEQRRDIALKNERYVAQHFRLDEMSTSTIELYKKLVK